MSRRFPKARRLTTAALAASVLMLGGCGQTGPLYLPKRPAPPAAPAAEPAPPASSSAAPAPASSTP